MKKSELRQLIKEEIQKLLKEESTYPNDVIKKEGNIFTTRNQSKYKIFTTQPKEGSLDFYYDTIMDRIEQLNPEDWDIDVKTYRKAIKIEE
jgi:tartrate dehydratase beta subunit/fumarate hydratase class I family protein